MANTSQNGTSVNSLYNPSSTGLCCDPNTTVGSLLQVANNNTGLTGSFQTVYDGAGNASGLSLSTAGINVTAFSVNGNSVTFGSGGTVAYSSVSLAQFASTTSLQLKTVISDETGSGSLVFGTSPTIATPSRSSYGITGTNTITNLTMTGTNVIGGATISTSTLNSPTLVTPILGTPSSGTLTSCTGLPISTGVSGLGTGVATALGVSVTGTAASGVVCKTSPTITTPIIAQINDTNSATMFSMTTTASAINYFSFTNSAATSGVTLAAVGGDSNVNLILSAKGVNGVIIKTPTGTVPVGLSTGTFQHNMSIPTLTGTRTTTFPDSNVTLASQVASIITFGMNPASTMSAGNTYYVASNTSGSGNNVAIYIPFAFTISKLYFYTITAPGGVQTLTATINKSGADSALTCAISGSNLSANDTTHSVTCAAGDYLSLKVALSGSAASTTYVAASLQVTTT